MDQTPIDFSQVDTVLLRSPNDFTSSHNSSDDLEYVKPNLDIPQNSNDSSKTDDKNNKIDAGLVTSLLDISAASSGIAVTEPMQNTVIALSNTLGLAETSLDWFCAGITFANNSMIMEQMVSAIKSLQVEVRNIQTASNGIKGTSEEFMSKLKSNKTEIIKEMDKTRDSVLGAISTMVTDEDLITPIPKTVEIGVKSNKNTKLTSAKPVNPVLLNPVLTKSISTKSPDEMIDEQKEKLLLDLGYELDEVMKYNSIELNLIVDDQMLEIAAAGLDDETKEILLNQAIDNEVALMTAVASLGQNSGQEASTSGTKGEE
ncbi:TPA_asm: P [Artemisia alphacytorhabdovirus 1]|nr:TPA_asm: P [Artemisia alphacytorhabdovirus 1]